jgi:hypothetical protein
MSLSIASALQDGRQVYVILDGQRIISDGFASAAEADRARARLIKQAKGKAVSTKG